MLAEEPLQLECNDQQDEEDLEHTIRIVGTLTRVIDRLEVGDVLGLRGPYGNGWPLHEARWKDVLVVTGGLGEKQPAEHGECGVAQS